MTEKEDKSKLSHKIARVGDCEIEYWMGGSGPPLVFIHGSEGFDPNSKFAQFLTRHFSLVAPSSPGFGKSSLPYWMDRMEDTVPAHLELLDQLDVKDAILVGTCVGGWIATELATLNSSRIRKVVLVGPVGIKVGSQDKLDFPDIFAMEDDRLLGLLYHDAEKNYPPLHERSVEELNIVARNRETLALLTWEPYMHNPKLRHRLHRLTLPTLLLRGSADGFVERWYVESFKNLLPNADLVEIPEAGHFPHIEQPEDFAEKILNFYSRS